LCFIVNSTKQRLRRRCDHAGAIDIFNFLARQCILLCHCAFRLGGRLYALGTNQPETWVMVRAARRDDPACGVVRSCALRSPAAERSVCAGLPGAGGGRSAGARGSGRAQTGRVGVRILRDLRRHQYRRIDGAASGTIIGRADHGDAGALCGACGCLRLGAGASPIPRPSPTHSLTPLIERPLASPVPMA
jgi:hypothetical protein